MAGSHAARRLTLLLRHTKSLEGNVLEGFGGGRVLRSNDGIQVGVLTHQVVVTVCVTML